MTKTFTFKKRGGGGGKGAEKVVPVRESGGMFCVACS